MLGDVDDRWSVFFHRYQDLVGIHLYPHLYKLPMSIYDFSLLGGKLPLLGSVEFHNSGDKFVVLKDDV